MEEFRSLVRMDWLIVFTPLEVASVGLISEDTTDSSQVTAIIPEIGGTPQHGDIIIVKGLGGPKLLTYTKWVEQCGVCLCPTSCDIGVVRQLVTIRDVRAFTHHSE